MIKTFATNCHKETQELGAILAGELKGGEIICLLGDLGAGKTTFTQGLLKGLKVKGSYTSPTFLIMKQYKARGRNPKVGSVNIYHIDAYRIQEKDILDLGWKEIIRNENNIVIIEWADRISGIIPRGSLWIRFEWLDKNKRRIRLKNS